jgi:hypothetical protein
MTGKSLFFSIFLREVFFSIRSESQQHIAAAEMLMRRSFRQASPRPSALLSSVAAGIRPLSHAEHFICFTFSISTDFGAFLSLEPKTIHSFIH